MPSRSKKEGLVAARWGLWGGLAVFLSMLLLSAPEGMPTSAWHASANFRF